MDVNLINLPYVQKPLRIITKVKVRPASRIYADESQKPMIEASALWDTGADCCAISTGMIAEMGIRELYSEKAGGFGGQKDDVPHYSIDIAIGDNHIIENVLAIAYESLGSHDIILGMNVITLGDFALMREGEGSRFVFKLE
jgi:hypothetical protein